MGFSAEGSIAEFASVNADANARPSYAATIYGAPFPDVPPIPKDVPPFFIGNGTRRQSCRHPDRRHVRSAQSRRYKPEFHIYEHGSHGSSMRKQGTTSDHWLEDFYWWLEAHGLTKPSK